MTINSYGNTADDAASDANPEKRQVRRYLQKITFVATFGGLLSGFDTGVINGVISIAATFIGIYLLDRVGRRPMMLLGFDGTTLALLVIGLVSTLVDPSISRAMLILGAMAFFLASMQGLIGLFFPTLVATLGIGQTLFVFVGAGVLSLIFSRSGCRKPVVARWRTSSIGCMTER